MASCTAQLACPVCGGSLGDDAGAARCPRGHSFDYARSGYLNLAREVRGRVGDTAAMVAARAEFLSRGHFEPLADAVAAGAVAAAPAQGVLAEIGCGTGYYVAAAATRLRQREQGLECAYGFDLSKAAAAHAARRHGEIGFVVADVEAGIPLRDGAVGVAISAFSPRPAAELGRVVRPGGELVVALAGPRHLERLRERLSLMSVHEDKLGRLGERLGPWFSPIQAETVEYEIELGAEDARRLVLMGPNAWHGVELGALAGGHADLVSVIVARYRRDRGAGTGDDLRGSAGAADELGGEEQGEGGEGELQGPFGDVVGDDDPDQDAER
jgi:23S rRNA (guanine745-N1)-methyltransferase